MTTEPQPIEWVEILDGEQRSDPAVASLNVSPETERDLVEAGTTK